MHEQTVMTDKTKDRRLGGEEYKHETDEDLERIDHLLLWRFDHMG